MREVLAFLALLVGVGMIVAGASIAKDLAGLLESKPAANTPASTKPTTTTAAPPQGPGQQEACFTFSVEVPSGCQDSKPVYVVWHWPEKEISVGVDCSSYGIKGELAGGQAVGVLKVWVDGEKALEEPLPAASNTYWIEASPGYHTVKVCYKLQG